jgi:hypothetical protein
LFDTLAHDAMTNIARALSIVVTAVIGAAALGGPALASPDSPFYPNGFQNPNLPTRSWARAVGFPLPIGSATRTMGEPQGNLSRLGA